MRMRARDKDRNQVLETLQQAYVEGQIDAEEFSRRNSAALSAHFLDQLEPLISDLQGAEPLAPDLPRAGTRPGSTARTKRRPWWTGPLAGLALIVAFLAIVVVPRAMYGTPDTRDTDFRSAQQKQEDAAQDHAASMRVMWSQVKDELTSRAYPDDTHAPLKDVGAWRLDVPTIKAVFAHWEHAFEAPYLRSASLRPDSLAAERPFGRTRPRVEEWRFKSGERGLDIVRAAEAKGRDLALFNLHDVDLEAMMRNIEQGKTSLKVKDAQVRWIDIDFASGEEVPLIEIWLGNTFDEIGFMRTALDGRVISERPYSAD